MTKLKIIEQISLDGVIQSSGEDDFPYSADGGRHGKALLCASHLFVLLLG
jgi:hypothetical protein